jgi:hypothetical protein
MTEEKFLRLVIDTDDCLVYKKIERKNMWERTQFNTCKLPKLPLEELYLYESWSGGGTTGGSCWDNSNSEDVHHGYPGESEVDNTSLDALLLAIAPDIKFLQYKKIEQLVERDNYSENEYYGNSSITCYKTINLKVLYDKLVEMGLL